MALRELLKKDTSWVAQKTYVQELGIHELCTPPASPKQGTPPLSPKQNNQSI